MQSFKGSGTDQNTSHLRTDAATTDNHREMHLAKGIEVLFAKFIQASH